MQHTDAVLQRPVISPTHLLDAPLPQLLDELGVELVESSITEPEFTGYVFAKPGDRLVLSMRRGQPEWERDVIARALLGDALRVPLPPLPAPYALTEL